MVEENNVNEATVEQEQIPYTSKFINYKIKVGGWLLVFCIGITIVSPIFYLKNIYDVITLPDYLSELRNYFMVDGFVGLALAFYSFYVGFRLFKLNPKAVNEVKLLLSVMLAVAVISLFIPYIMGVQDIHKETILKEGIIDLIRKGIFVLIWSLYFAKSRRVKQTYNLE